MNEELDEQQRMAHEIIEDYVGRRIEWYKKIKLQQILAKDYLLFAARGALTANEYVIEAFHAVESSSEETSLGNFTQRMIAKISDQTLDSGDLTTEREGAIWVCELKAQTNTTNSSSFPQELRGLRTRMNEIKGRRRTSNQPVKAALCITRDWKSIDEVRVYHCPEIQVENRDLDGFEYRYLSGAAMWRWLTGRYDSAVRLLMPLMTMVDTTEIKEERERAISRLERELTAQLKRHHLNTTIDDVAELCEQLNQERNEKRIEKEAKKRARESGRH